MAEVVRARRPVHSGLCYLVAIGAALFVPAEASAQTASAHTATADSLIASAEADGATHPRAERSRPLPAEWDARSWWGSADRKCVEVRGRGPARSGEFIIGGELGTDPPIYAGIAVKIWWAPLHNSRTMEPLSVVGERLSSPMQMRLTLETVAFPVQPGQRIAEADREYFYPGDTVIPDAGRWLLVASSGDNWGCFIMNVGRGAARPRPDLPHPIARYSRENE